MFTIRSIADLRRRLNTFRRDCPDGTIGFVPTMGYLHDGHRSLMRQAREQNERVVVSLFVNPTQFGPGEDFDKYPRDEDRDMTICLEESVDCVFAPPVDQMYPPDPLTTVSVSRLTQHLCGRFRPGHFDGVATVVAKLFNIVQPDRAYFGQKDAQQALVIERLTSDLNFPIDIIICPTVRESDGLAMSSRNVRLSPAARLIAPAIYRALTEARRLAATGERNVRRILEAAQTVMNSHPEMTVQYLECRDRATLDAIDILEKPALLATAVYLDSVRLIDNVFLFPGGSSE